MPRFHFHTSDAVNGAEHDSCDLPDLAAARREAVIFAGDILRQLGAGIYRDQLRVMVTDEQGALCWDLKIVGVEGEGAR